MPIIAFDMLYSIKILSNAVNAFNSRCARGIKANTKAINANLERNLSLATALSPYIGYAKAADIAAKAYREGKTVKEVCLAEGIMPKQELDRILNPKNLV
jgi:Fumarase